MFVEAIVTSAAILTAPSMSTMSRFVVPSTSMFPEMSKEAAAISPLATTAPFISIVVAAICISVSATMSNCPSVLS